MRDELTKRSEVDSQPAGEQCENEFPGRGLFSQHDFFVTICLSIGVLLSLRVGWAAMCRAILLPEEWTSF